jgi:hypothetical protein
MDVLFGIIGAICAGVVIGKTMFRILRKNGFTPDNSGSQDDLLAVFPVLLGACGMGAFCLVASSYGWQYGLASALLSAPITAVIFMAIRLTIRGIVAVCKLCSSI